jgi:hypothetical protein
MAAKKRMMANFMVILGWKCRVVCWFVDVVGMAVLFVDVVCRETNLNTYVDENTSFHNSS